jgi:glycogen phosphorylase
VACGERDIARAAEELAARVPAALAPLARLAYNYRWAWLPDGDAVFRAVDRHRWELCGHNPVRLLEEASYDGLSRALRDPVLLARIEALAEAVRADLERAPLPGSPAAGRPVAFVCAEYAVHPSLPIYSGGLGVLAGDFLKEASDRGADLVAIGLLYRQGYFRQALDDGGWQHEYWLDSDPERLPAALVTAADGQPLTITAPINDREVRAQIWRVDVGRVPLFLLDAERPENGRLARWITSRLYVGDRTTRLCQYALLGIGGMRALEALGIEPRLVHLNEGHAALAPLELARRRLALGTGLPAALESARGRVVFTTHTPVAAGNDTYEPREIVDVLGGFARTLGLQPDELLRFGRSDPEDDAEPFGVTQLALRASRAANGVSRRHGAVAREMWRSLWPDRSVEQVPIGHVTNGVHAPTWIGAPMGELLDRHLGEGWEARATQASTWAALSEVRDAELWDARRRQRAAMVEYVRDRSVADRLSRGEPRDYVEAAAEVFDPDVLTIGFARRLATYKRLALLVRDPGRALALLAGDRPVQIVLAGKAHPSDQDGKRIVQTLFTLKHAPQVAGRVVYLHDYDLATALRLVQGCDVWVNLPRPPLEASGTSGMKSALNGGLQLSTLDGWWAEAYAPDLGWALPGEVDPDHEAQDARDGAELYRLLGEEVLPAFYERDADGLPRSWLARMRSSIATLSPAFCAGRMLADYSRLVYEDGAAH